MKNNKLNKRTIIFLLLLFISFLFQSLGSVILNDFFPKEKKIYDPRFQQLAYNLYTHHTFAIRWGTWINPNQIMINPYEIQKGVYYNWFPVGYAFIIYVTMLININYFPILYLLQLILYSFIPPLIFLLSYDFLFKKNKSYFIATLSALLFLLNPYYLISAIWITDTWMTSLITILCFYLLLLLKTNNNLKIKLIFGLFVLLLFFFRPISLLSMLICFTIYIIGVKKIFSLSAYYISVL